MNEIIRHFPFHAAPLYVPMAGISFCDGSYHIRRENSATTVIEYVLSGTGFVTVDGEDQPVTADTVYLLFSGTDHNYYSSANDPWQKIFINIEGELPLLLQKEYGLEGKWLFDGAGLKDIFEQVATIVRQGEDSCPPEERIAGLFFEAIARLGRRLDCSSHSIEAIRLRDYLDSHPERLIGNEELAASVFRSPDYCVKLFRREFHTTPYNYQIDSKMRLASQLLRSTTLPVARIGEQVGYHDPGYFSGLFRRKMGCSPRQWRNGKRQL